ncbi:MAG: glycoside hydrolase family 127 protein, partial [Candidatus Omnitrophica bacterium]|nr:glycoside hydrolase family 127 protein [Candidatus Omnitrophota bacterium]
MNALWPALLTMSAIVSSPTETPFVPAMRAVPFTRVTVEDSFWKPRIEANRTQTIPHNFKLCEETGRISNFAKAAKRMEGKFEGIYFNDSDVYKLLEGAAYAVAISRDEEIGKKADEVIDLIAAAQQSDGYLNTYYTLVEPDKRWTDLPVKHELYCAGHLIEAAVAHWNATGSRKFLEVAIRLADHIDSIFGEGKRYGFPGHEELEIALLKLFEATGETRYRDLAGFFLHARGQERKPEQEHFQAHAPLVEHTDIVGHAVRAMYLYTAAADWTALTGQRTYLPALERVWRSVTERRMYLTGGIGSKRENEGFSADYDLPNDSAYCETCASIGMAFWNHRMLLLHGESRFADVLERVAYNGLLSGVSLEGDKFFYENPLASRGKHHRKPWYDCACCPPNVARFLPTIGGYLYGESDDALWVNLYAAGNADLIVGGDTSSADCLGRRMARNHAP